MRAQDMAFPTYREHGVLYCRGIDPIMPLSLFRGVNQGGWDPIANKFGIQVQILLDLNGLQLTSNIRPGQEIKLPAV